MRQRSKRRYFTRYALSRLCTNGATRGVTVSTSALLACHQCFCAGSSLAWGLNLRALVRRHFLKLVARVFFPRTPVSFPPLSVNGSANKIQLK